MSIKNNISDHDDDLKGAPHLSKLAAGNSFKAGSDYFENFASSLQDHIDTFEDIRSEAPLLSDIPKYNPFTAPHHYFDELPAIVQQKIINKKSSSILEWLVLLIKPRFAVPVLTTLFIAVSGINYMNNHAEGPAAEMTEEVSVEEQLYGIDESTIIETLSPAENSENEKVVPDENSIENYLMDNNVEETALTKSKNIQ